jgi:hypothetical protein
MELVMADSDDTVVASPKVPNEEPRTSPLGRPFYPSDDADPRQSLQGRLAGISMAINVLTGLLANSESFRDLQACNMPTGEGEWPLPPTCVEGVFAAVHFLSLYAESLSYRLGEMG